MKNKKRTYTIVAILLAVVALGIGYAAATTLLTVNGTATAVASDGADLDFTNATASGGQTGTSASVDSQDSSVGVCTVALKTAGESATCTFTIARASTMDAGVNVVSMAASVYSDSTLQTAWSSSDEWFTITPTLAANTLADSATTTLTVQVTLKKANLTGSSVTENFYVKVAGDVANAA